MAKRQLTHGAEQGTKVMMIGTHPTGKGGIASVIRGYFDGGIMRRLGIDYYSEHKGGSKIFEALFYVKTLPKIALSMRRYEIVHVHTASWWSFRRLLLLIFLAKALKKKTIIHVHGAMFHLYYRGATSFEKYIIERSFTSADKVVALSNEWKNRVAPLCGRDKIEVIPNGVQIRESFNVIIPRKLLAPPLLLFLGEIGERKGVFDFLNALKLMKNRSEQARVLLCGNGDVELARRSVNDLGLQNVVSVPGWVSGEEKEKLLEQAYIYVLPSHNEGLPVSILEAMAYATPVVSTPVGGIPDAVIDGYNGFLVPPREPTLLARRIAQLLENRELWMEMSGNALRTIKARFSMQEVERRLRALYDGLSVG